MWCFGRFITPVTTDHGKPNKARSRSKETATERSFKRTWRVFNGGLAADY
jgi:hypothetical protein